MFDVSNYIESLDEYIFNKYCNAVNNNKKLEVILYGAGEKSKIFIEKHNDVSIKVYCDECENKVGKVINGIKVISLEALIDERPDLPIIITAKMSDDISRKLREYGFDHVYHRFAIEYLSHLEELQNVYDLLQDETSREVFTGLITYVFKQDPDIFPGITQSEDQYFLQDLFEFTGEESIIDGGAFTGDTLKDYISKFNGKLGNYYCFEPDEENYSRLKNNIEELRLGDRIKTYPYGLFSKESEIPFSSLHSSASCFNPCSSEYIKVISIDECIKGKVISMIKMDIEGAECEALVGAKDCITKYKPKLAICLYHLESDLWKIPLMINTMNDSYKLHIRHHNKKCWYETVLYATV